MGFDDAVEKIIQKNHQRLILSSYSTDKTPNHIVEAVLSLHTPQFRYCGLWTDDRFKIRNEIDQNLTVLANRFQYGGFPGLDAGFAFSEPEVN